MAVHAHNSKNFSAYATFRRLTPHQQLLAVWIYIPLSRSDRIVELAERTFSDETSNIIVRVTSC